MQKIKWMVLNYIGYLCCQFGVVHTIPKLSFLSEGVKEMIVYGSYVVLMVLYLIQNNWIDDHVETKNRTDSPFSSS